MINKKVAIAATLGMEKCVQAIEDYPQPFPNEGSNIKIYFNTEPLSQNNCETLSVQLSFVAEKGKIVLI